MSVATQGANALQFLCGVYLAKDIKSLTVRLLGESAEFSVGKCSGDQQDGIRAMGPSLDDLVLIDDEVFPEARESGYRRRRLEIRQAALEKWLVGEHRQCRGTGPLEGLCQCGGIEILADQAL